MPASSLDDPMQPARRVLYVAAALGALFIVGRQFQAPAVQPSTPPDLAETWNAEVRRLGLQPLYPPQEDFQVGDVFAVIGLDHDESTEGSALLGRSTRIARLTLKDEILKSQAGMWSFEDTLAADKPTGVFRQKRTETIIADGDSKKITLTLAAFPSVTFRHALRAEASGGGGFLGLFRARQSEAYEELRIPIAETYGVPTEVAFGAFTEFCAAPATAIYCQEQYVRKLLGFTIDRQVLDPRPDCNYRFQLGFKVVTRVYLTREIIHRVMNGTTDAVGFAAALGGQTAVPAASPPPLPQSGNANAAPAAASGPAQPASVSPGGQVTVAHASAQEIVLQQVFQRPVAFGFRAINIALNSPRQPESTCKDDAVQK